MKIRQAQKEDINSILNLLNEYTDSGVILPRTAQDIEKNLATFLVAETDNEIIGTVAYHKYGSHLQEIRSLAVQKNCQQSHVGSKLVAAMVKNLLAQFSKTKIFTLTYVPEFFKKCFFEIVDKNIFPEKIWKDCQYCKRQATCGETALIYKRDNVE